MRIKPIGEKALFFFFTLIDFLQPRLSRSQMEFIDHLGINLEKDQEVQYLFIWFKGLLCLSTLFFYILFYQVIAFFCTLASVFVPDTANMLRNTCGNFFWDLALYLMVCLF